MDLSISLGLLGWGVVVVGALAFGVGAQFVGQTRTDYEWLIDAVAAFAGALIASEFVVAWRGFEPVFEGLALIPAVAGAIVLGGIVDLLTRASTGGRYIGAAA
jgi:uncharacterized membrane protein YeaQ/YmgE (transglycosylase-associated protein family)